MKPTEMPVYKLTADSIWNSFQSSGRRHLLLTGGRGSGKTTLLSQIVPTVVPGVITWAESQSCVYLRENLTGESVQIERYDSTLSELGNQKHLCPERFIAHDIPALEWCVQAEGKWVFIDEIGDLECSCQDYCDAVQNLMEHKCLIAGVQKQVLPFLLELCSRCDVFLVDLDQPFGGLGCVIMASGLGKRFGGHKLMADFRGIPLLCHALDATDGIFTRRVVVTRHTEVETLCRKRGISVLRHDLPYRSDTVRLGLQAIGSDIDGCLFCPGDQPLLRWSTVASLALAATNDKNVIWRTVFETTVGSPVLFPRWTFSELLMLPKGKGGSAVMRKYPERVRTISVQERYELEDVDTPEDLWRLQMLHL